MNFQKKPIPVIPLDLLEYLEKQYPNVVPMGFALSVEDLRMIQGQQTVVQLLRRHFDAQNTTVLNR